MRRFVSLAVLLFFTVPFGASLAGCGSKTTTVFCNTGDSGPVVGQVASIQLSPSFATYGESLNYGQIGSTLTATAYDCHNTVVAVKGYTYATSDMSFADINPTNGSVCGGTWNRNSGGGIPDYSICTAPGPVVANITGISAPAPLPNTTTNVITLAASNTLTPGELVTFANFTVPPPPPPDTPPLGDATFLNGQTLPVLSATPTSFTISYNTPAIALIAVSGTATAPMLANPAPTKIAKITATTDGGVSNGFNVYVHPVVTGFALGNPSATPADCSTDPATNCCAVISGTPVVAPPYDATQGCLSQGVTRQLAARAYRNGTTNPLDNITCTVGHIQYTAQNPSVLTIDQNGVATAAQPGSTILTASVSNSGSGGAAGFYATCPPASIVLSVPGQSGNSATVNLGTSQPLLATVTDTYGQPITGAALTYSSTSPSTIPAASTIVPLIPGAATITAACEPPTCNPSPFSQIGLYGNGETVTSNGIEITAPGNNATVLYMASTQSLYLRAIDFSLGQQGGLLRLPYVPNSMVISQDGNFIYLGSSTALMTVSTSSNTLTATNLAVSGTVLSVSPDGTTLVVADTIRKTISLVTSAGAVTTAYGGVGSSAQWAPDSQTVYITAANNQLLVHSNYLGWFSTTTAYQYNDVAVTVPGVGAFFAANGTTEARSYCPTTIQTPGNPPVTTNTYYPVASDTVTSTDKIAATDDGAHILGATVTPVPTIKDISVSFPTYPFETPTGTITTQPALACTTATAPTTSPVTFTTSFQSFPLAGVAATMIDGVVPASNSALAFVTYMGSSGLLPLYVPASGTVNYVPLSGGTDSAPVAGVFSTDNSTFYVGTSGDNQVHVITVTGTTATDTSVIAPALPDASGNIVVPNLLVQRPKRATS